MSSSIAVFGSINMDLVIFSQDKPSEGETIFGNSFHTFQGGKGANQAVAASRLEIDVSFIGKIGVDIFGKQLRDNLVEENINVEYLEEHNSESGVAFINVFEKTSENQIIVVPGANSYVESSQVPDALLSSTDILISQLEIPPNQIEDLFSRAGNHDCFRILNAAPIISFEKNLITETDLLVVNESELESLSGYEIDKDNLDTVVIAIESLNLQDSQSVVVTLGAKGAYVSKGKKDEFIPGHKVSTLDTTGSGDCFIGALASCYQEKENLFESVQFANKAAALSTTKKGTSNSMPTKDEVVKFIQTT